MISLRDVSVTFPDGAGSILALDSASLSVEPGTISAITGPSGSGKSTLLSVASTLLTASSGEVTVDGINVARLSARERAELRRDRIGIVFQQPSLIASLTVREQLVVMTHLGSRGSGRRGAVSRADQLLDAVGLSDHADRRPSQLSGGQRQRVNIARALMNRPAVVIIDEPTSALDHKRGSEIIDLIVRLTRGEQASTLLVTHDLSHLARMDHAYDMLDGVLTPRVMAAAGE